MTQLEFQNAISKFFTINDGKVQVNELKLKDKFIELNCDNDNVEISGITINRGEGKMPLNIVWDENSETLSFTTGAELVKTRFHNPGIKTVKTEGKDIFIDDEDVIISTHSCAIYLPKIYNKRLTIKVLKENLNLFASGGKNVGNLQKGTYTLIQCDGEWIDIS